MPAGDPEAFQRETRKQVSTPRGRRAALLINLDATLQYTHPLRQGYALYVRGGPGYYLPESGGGKLGAVSGLGITYDPGGRWSLAFGADFHVIREGMAVYNLGPASNRDDVRFMVLSLGAVRSW